MKKNYLAKIAYLTAAIAYQGNTFPMLFPQKQIAPLNLPSQREFAKEAIELQFLAKPILAPETGLISYTTQRGDYKLTFEGYIKADLWWDSWQVSGVEQEHFSFFPMEPIYDICGRDILHKGRFNMLTIQTQLRFEIEGPRAFGARTYGVIQPDFWGGDLVNIVNIMRLLEGYVYLDWGDKSLLIGKYLHPVFPAEYKCYAQTISYDYGLPFDPYAIAPQIRFTKQVGFMSYQFSMMSPAYKFFGGPSGIVNELYARNAILPNFNFLSVASIGKHRIGVDFDIVRIVPRLRTNLALPPSRSFKNVESLISFLAQFFVVLDYKDILFKFKTIWAQNGAGYAFISGYGVKCIDPLTDARVYINTQQVNTWIDVTFRKFMPFEPGFFFGFSKNLGAPEQLIPFINGTDSIYVPNNRHHINYLLRFAPRIRWYSRPFVAGTELEFTRAYWGHVDNYARVINASPRNNLRFLFAAYYYY